VFKQTPNKKKHCNIPLVSNKNFTYRTYQRLSIQESYLRQGMSSDATSEKQGLIISVSINTIKTNDILVLAPRGYIKVFGPKIFIVSCCFSL